VFIAVIVNYFLILNRTCARLDIEYAENTLDFTYPGIGANLFTMALEGIVFFSLTIILEQKFFVHKITGLFKAPGGEEEVEFSPNEVSVVYTLSTMQPKTMPLLKDSDVAQEKRRLNTDGTSDDLIQLKNLKKVSCVYSFMTIW